MKYAYLADMWSFQPQRQRPGHSMLAWLQARIGDYRAWAADRESIACLRQLDRQLLADMGIDADSLGGDMPNLPQSHPRVAALQILTNCLSAPAA